MREFSSMIISSAGTFLKGMAIGIAQIIPGVSGGTLALILGIYSRFIRGLNAVSSAFGAFLAWVAGFKKEKRNVFAGRLAGVEWAFLIVLAVGMLVAILATSGLITWLLENHRAPTYGFFFGLIIASVIVPWEKMERRRLPELVSFLAGLFLLLWISGLGTDLPAKIDATTYDRILTAHTKPDKQALLRRAYTMTGDGYVLRPGLNNAEKEGMKKILQDSGKPALWFLFLAGAVSVSAMILPGLSGSFVLLVMGCYGYVVGLINLLKKMDTAVFLPLGVFGLGLVVGLFSFARLMEFLLKKYHSITMAFLIGLMLGSLRKIFPFGAGIRTPVLPVILAILAGIVIVLSLHFWSRKQPQEG